MKPWCAEGEVPTAANLNLHRGWNSQVGWHCDDEPLFGGAGCSKLIVSVSFGSTALFKWKGKSCPDSEARLCCLGHGDILVMDGNVRTSFFIVRILVWNRNGLTSRSVGSDNMLPPVPCGQGWHVFCQRVRRVHQFLLRGLWEMVVSGLSGSSLEPGY